MKKPSEPTDGRKTYLLVELGLIVCGEVAGDLRLPIHGVSDLAGAVEGEISFITDAKYLAQLKQSKASAVLAPANIPIDRHAIIVDRPELALVKLLNLFAPPPPNPEPGLHPTAVVESPLPASVAVGANSYVGAGTTIGENTIVYPNVYIGPEVAIGCDCTIWPGVVIRERITIGKGVIIHPNATIGGDGFGYNFLDGRHHKIPHIGTVIIEDDVEIGSCTCVDRAKMGATVIESGAKLDNLIQIAHNVRIGRCAVLAGQVGIAGSVSVGQYVVMGGAAGAQDHVSIGDRTQMAAKSEASKDLPADSKVKGWPAIEIGEYQRQQVRIRRLGTAFKRLSELTKRVDELEQTIHDLKGKRT